MLLEKKIAIVYGAGGAVGGAVARGFAREGAKVHLTGRDQQALFERPLPFRWRLHHRNDGEDRQREHAQRRCRHFRHKAPGRLQSHRSIADSPRPFAEIRQRS